MFCIYGGTRYEPQEDAMRRGIDILVGTPGRILDHMHRGGLNLRVRELTAGDWIGL